MIYIIIRKIIFIKFLIISSFAFGDNSDFNRIEVLVNENVITNYDITQRLKINAILNRIEINDDNYSQLLNSVIDDLIIEKLKNKKIDEYDIDYEDDEFEKQERIFYSNINYEKEKLEELFSLNNINYSYLLDFVETDFKWQKLIYGLYLRVTSVTEKEVIDLMSKNPDMTKEKASDVILQKQLEIKSQKLIKDLRDEATIEYK